jgi:microcystin-dependent protein
MKKQPFAKIEEGFFNFVTDYVNQPKVDLVQPKIDEIKPYLVPRGVIVIWSGRANEIPTGWALCDGTNNTPDLRGRFILGGIAGTGTNSIGNKGGVSEINIQPFNLPDHNHNVQVKFSNISTSTNGHHSHSIADNVGGVIQRGGDNRVTTQGADHSYYEPNIINDPVSQSGGSYFRHDGNHSHTFNLDNTFTTNNGNQQTKGLAIPSLPPYYALAYIMKL